MKVSSPLFVLSCKIPIYIHVSIWWKNTSNQHCQAQSRRRSRLITGTRVYILARKKLLQDMRHITAGKSRNIVLPRKLRPLASSLRFWHVHIARVAEAWSTNLVSSQLAFEFVCGQNSVLIVYTYNNTMVESDSHTHCAMAFCWNKGYLLCSRDLPLTLLV